MIAGEVVSYSFTARSLSLPHSPLPFVSFHLPYTPRCKRKRTRAPKRVNESKSVLSLSFTLSALVAAAVECVA